MIEITTDSCSDLGQELSSQYHIRTIPLHIYIDGRNINDGDLTLEEFFRVTDQAPELPKTSAPAQKELMDFFAAGAEEKIFIGISSKLSATVPNAIIAAEHQSQNRVQVIDSLNLSAGIGLLVLKAAELRDAGCSLDEITRQVTALIPQVHTTFIIDTLDYLYKGGRCSAVELLVGSLLKIRPVIEVRPDGTLGVKEKLGGSRKKALASILKDFELNLPHVDLHRVFITHTGCPADAEYLAGEIRRMAPVEHIHITTAGATIASHCGPNTIGILYLQRNA